MNDLQRLANALETGANAVHIDTDIRRRAEVSIRRMLEFGTSVASANAADSVQQI